MRRLFMYLILAGSITVVAQLQLQDMENSGGAAGDVAGDSSGLTGQAENEPAEEASPAEGQSDSVAAETAARNTSEDMPVSKDDENEFIKGEEDETGDSAPYDEDFNPDEEISEDYPVPLPSDI